MDKTKFAILVALLLALLFFAKMEADASANDYGNSRTYTVLDEFKISEVTNNYRFRISADGVTVNDDTFYSFVGDTAVVNLDCVLGATSLVGYEGYGFDRLAFDLYLRSDSNLTYIDYSNGLAVFEQTLTKVLPYVIINGEKKYLKNYYHNSFDYDVTLHNSGLIYGFEVQLLISYSGTGISDTTVIDTFGVSTLTLSFYESDCVLVGYKYLSTGDTGIITELKNLFTVNSSMNSRLQSVFELIGTLNSNLVTKFDTFWNNLSEQMSSWQAAIDTKFDELKNTLIRSYDSSGAESTNTELTETLDSWEAAEGTTMSDAKIEVSAYDTSSAFDFAPALVSSMTLITTFANGFFRASGDFSTALIVMIALVFVSVVVGLVRFVK